MPRPSVQFVCVNLLMALAITVYAQSDRGSITGTVTDSTGAVVPRVAVVVRNSATNTSRETLSTESGKYVFQELPVGVYNLTVKQTGRLDVLVNNAGIGIHKNLEKITAGEMKKQFEVNFYGTVYCIKAFLSLLKQSEAGYIVNTGSLAGELSFADNSIYAATKSAIEFFAFEKFESFKILADALSAPSQAPSE